jgi:hypothetical protein
MRITTHPDRKTVRNAALLSICAVCAWLLLIVLPARTPHVIGMDENVEVVHDTVPAFSTNVWVLRFTGLKPAHWQINARSRLSCLLFDPTGRQVIENAIEDTCHREWVPSRSGAYRIEVRNPGHKATPYTLRVLSDTSSKWMESTSH